MSDEIRVNRAPSPMAGAPMSNMPAMQPAPAEPSSKMPWVILAAVVILLVVLGIVFRGKLFGGSGDGGKTAPAKLSGYQAVFLTNGQVYFGRLAGQDESTMTLKDIYYLQVVQPPLQGQQQAGQQGAAAAQQQPQISLVKLGSELHGPVDEMHIYKNQVLFYEDMKDDGKVAQAIKDYKANPNPAPAAPAAQGGGQQQQQQTPPPAK